MTIQKTQTLAVFGLGYVGCVTAACLARRGCIVVGIDTNASKITAIAAGRSPIAEPGLCELIATQVDAGRLRVTESIEDVVGSSEMGFVTVGTPSRNDGSADTSSVEQVVDQIVSHLAPDQSYTIVVRSTLIPGVLEERLAPKLVNHPNVTICNHPEFLRETTAIADFENPPVVVVGTVDNNSASAVLQLYNGLNCPKVVTDTRTAAMVKYTSNAFHALKIVFANEIGTLSKSLGVNGQEVMEIACLDTQLNISNAYLRPGFAFGGSCLPKDVRALSRVAQLAAIKTEVIGSILNSNGSHLERALAIVRSYPVRRIGLVGLAFKAGTDDLRESPLVTLAETLLGQGYELRIYDPDVQVASLVGANRSFIQQRLPHLAQFLCDPCEIAQHSELLLVSSSRNLPFATQSCACPIIDLEKVLVIPTKGSDVK